MPLVEVSIVAGRPPGPIRELIHQLHLAVQTSLEAPSESVRVIVREIPRNHWAVGDVTKAEELTAGTRNPTEPTDHNHLE